MGNCPDVCCFKNVKIIKELKVEIIKKKNNENVETNYYLSQPNYSTLLFLQTRVKRFLKTKNNQSQSLSNQNNITSSNMTYNNIISNSINTFPLKRVATAEFNKNLSQKITEKDDHEVKPKNKNKNNINKIDIIDEQKIYFPKIILYKGSNMFQQDLFSKSNPNINNCNEDPRNGPFDNKRRKYPKLTQDIFSYEGEWKNGKRDGIGILVKKEIAKFIGEFVEDKVCGFGKLIDVNGEKYIGYWKESQASGLGIYSRKEIISYKGYWDNDKQNGFGTEKWPNLEYIGEYLNGDKEGYGVLNIRDGVYEGEMKDGNLNGIGSFLFKDKRKYQGEYINNKIEGYGILTWPDGKVFVGTFRDNLEDGFGVFYTSKKYILVFGKVCY